MQERVKDIHVSQLLPEVRKLQANLLDSDPFVINIAGQSGSGKSTISKLLSNGVLGDLVLNMDDYLKGGFIENLNHDSGDPDKPFLAGLNPAVYDLSQLRTDALRLKKGLTVEKPVFDEVTRTRAGSQLVQTTGSLILEGIYALDPEFLELADLAILVEAPLHDRLMRKLIRNNLLYRRDADGIVNTYLSRDEPTYTFHRDRLHSAADLVVNNPGNPPLEYHPLLRAREFLSSYSGSRATPKPGYGNIHPTEALTFIEDQEGATLRYTVSNKMLIDSQITATTFTLIQKFYTIES